MRENLSFRPDLMSSGVENQSLRPVLWPSPHLPPPKLPTAHYPAGLKNVKPGHLEWRL